MANKESLKQWQNAERTHLNHKFSDPLLIKLHEASQHGEFINIYYSGGSTPGESRKICPIKIFTVDGYDNYYVEAFCDKRNENRTFRVDRMSLEPITIPSYNYKDIPSYQSGKINPRSSNTGCLSSIIFVSLCYIIYFYFN